MNLRRSRLGTLTLISRFRRVGFVRVICILLVGGGESRNSRFVLGMVSFFSDFSDLEGEADVVKELFAPLPDA